MGQEIERKFLTCGDAWRSESRGVLIRQGYLCTDPERTVRVRTSGGRGYITVKSRARRGVRAEFEYEIPEADADVLLRRICHQPLIEKTRHRVGCCGHVWEIDVFAGENTGLVLAEIELQSVSETFERPPWLGAEVTDDPRYLNVNLCCVPFRRWAENEGSLLKAEEQRFQS